MARGTLRPVWDRAKVDLDELTNVLGNKETDRDLETALSRVPRGLVHAESIALVRKSPEGFAPLAPESAWSSAGRSLAVACSRSPEPVVRDIGWFSLWQRRVQQRLRGAPSLVRSILEDRLSAEDRLELSVRLEVGPEALARLENQGWLPDLGWMAARPFGPKVSVAPELRPAVARARGAATAYALSERISPGNFPLFVSDDVLTLDLLSPYPRDLGHALYAWAIEHADRLQTRNLAEIIRSQRHRPDADLASIAASDLFSAEPNRGLLLERREAERSQGLFITDDTELAAGYAELSRLEQPDPVAGGARGFLAFFAGSNREALEGAVEAWIEDRRPTGFGFVGRHNSDGTAPIVPKAIISEHDGFQLELAHELRQAALATGVGTANPDLMDLDYHEMWIAKSLGRIRRSITAGFLTPVTTIGVAFYPINSTISPTDAASRRACLQAARIVLSKLLASGSELASGRELGDSSPLNRPLGRTFRP